MGERGQVARRAHRPSRRDDREHAAAEALEQELHRLHARARMPLRERVCSQEHRRADDLVGVRLADPAGVAAQQPQLELLRQLPRDPLRDEAAEAGVDAVRVLVEPVRGALDERSSGTHLRPGLVGQLGACAVHGDVPDVGDGEVVAGQPHRRFLGHCGQSTGVVRRGLPCSRARSSPRRAAAARARATRRGPSTPSRAPAAATAAPAGISPTSSEPASSAPRAWASSSTRATSSWSAVARQSSTFMLTWTSPARGARARARARPESRRRARARPGGDLSRNVHADTAEVHVERDQRRVGRRRAPLRPSDRAAAGRSRARARASRGVAEAPRGRRAGRTPVRAPARARRRGRPAAPSSSPMRSATASAAARARGMSSGRIGTTGTTSAAPMQGCTPSCRRRSISSRRVRPHATSAPRARRRSPTTVKTDRLWSGSTWTSSSRACADRASRDRVDRGRFPPLREVRNGFERDRHARTLGP